jgi:hypothetical protein
MLPINRHPSTRELRQFAAIWLPAFVAVVGGLIWYRTGSIAWASVAWLPGVALSVACWLAPSFARRVFIGWMTAAWPIGWLVSHLLLAAVYYLVMTPIGLTLRLAGRDPLHRHFDREAKTYWVPRATEIDPSRYLQQF